VSIEQSKTVLAIGAHPDDIEILCAGTLALLHEQDWRIEFATMTPGDCGSTSLPRGEISRIRKEEAANSARMLDGKYHCMECDDIFVDRKSVV
jgi:LmbE family N-acetylglucosaminyl deacetylase